MKRVAILKTSILTVITLLILLGCQLKETRVNIDFYNFNQNDGEITELDNRTNLFKDLLNQNKSINKKLINDFLKEEDQIEFIYLELVEYRVENNTKILNKQVKVENARNLHKLDSQYEDKNDLFRITTIVFKHGTNNLFDVHLVENYIHKKENEWSKVSFSFKPPTQEITYINIDIISEFGDNDGYYYAYPHNTGSYKNNGKLLRFEGFGNQSTDWIPQYSIISSYKTALFIHSAKIEREDSSPQVNIQYK